MREFIENKSRKPTELALFGDIILVDLKSTDCIKDYTVFMLKKVWKQRFGKAPTGEDYSCYVNRRNGNISIRGEGIEYWSKDTKANIKNFIDSKIQHNIDEHEEEQREEQRKREFVQKLIRKYPDLHFEEPSEGGSSYVSVDTEINGLPVTIDSDWEITYSIADTQRNSEKIIDFLRRTNFDDYEEEDDDE